MRKMIFFDIDGTISDEQTGEIPESAIRAIRKARENGHIAIVNSGRTLFSIDSRIKEIGFDGYICGCGTALYEGEKCFYLHTLSEKLRKKIMEKARETKVTAVYEGSKHVFFDQTLPQHEVVDMLMKRFGLNGRTVPPVLEGDMIEFEKFCVWLSKEADMSTFREYFKDEFHFIDRGDDMFEIVPLGISKATGIQGFMDHYQIPLENCYALGDSTNDLDMLKFVPHSIAMGHCMEEILPYCEYQTDKVEEDGLEKALKHYGII